MIDISLHKPMIRKQKEYQQALILRKKGKSIRRIAKILSISPSTASKWCKQVKLTDFQKEKLKRGRVIIKHLRKLARQSHLKKISRVRKLFQEAKSEIKSLSDRELFLIGIALYWAEGFKNEKEGRLGFCNSDPRMIKFIIRWFKKALKVKTEDFVLRAEFNESHKERTQEIENYWSKLTRVPLMQFNKPFYQHSKWLREYPNRNTYFGVLRIRVRKSSELLNKMRGWISGLNHSI